MSFYWCLWCCRFTGACGDVVLLVPVVLYVYMLQGSHRSGKSQLISIFDIKSWEFLISIQICIQLMVAAVF